MTPEQRRLVQESFDAVRDQARPMTLLFYGRVFELDPSARRLFHNDLALQGRKLVDTLDTVTQALDRFESLRPRLIELGRLHAGFGVRVEQYDVITTALLWALAQALGPDFDAATRDAWKSVLAAITSVMKEGALQHT
jgi:hemoglobin-like flavoprotein